MHPHLIIFILPGLEENVHQCISSYNITAYITRFITAQSLHCRNITDNIFVQLFYYYYFNHI